MAEQEDNEQTRQEKRFERRAGLTIALLAAVLAVNDLFAGKFGEDEIIGTNEKANAYSWYQSKSQKQTLYKHQVQLLETLRSTGVIPDEGAQNVIAEVDALKTEIERYEHEKEEILKGSEAIPPEHWSIEDENGEKGHYEGARAMESKLEVLDAAGGRFDLGTLFLQLCLVLGAVSLVLEEMSLKQRFYWAMAGCGTVGTVFTAWALLTAFSA